MTVQATVRKAGPTPGNSLATVFPFAFKVFAATDILVTQTVIATGVQSVLVLNDPAGYTVALNPDQNANPGGSVVYNPSGVPMPATLSLTISSVVPQVQGTHLQNGGAFFAQNIEDAVDKVLINLQDLGLKILQAIRFPVADSASLNAELPAAAQRANQFVAFDANGNVIASPGPSATPISAAMIPVVQAATTDTGLTALGFSTFVKTLIGAATVTAFRNLLGAVAGIWPLVLGGLGFDASGIAKGGLISGTGAGTAGIVPVGADGTVPLADSTQASGLKYVTLGAGAVRQSVQQGVTDANGYANMVTTGAGLRPGLSATARACIMAFASGFGQAGAQDLVTTLPADVADIIGADLPANNTSFISADYVSPVAVTWSKTLCPPQYGYAFDRSRQSMLQFAGASGSTVFLDDYGNTWAAQGGAKVQNNNFKFGTGGLGGGGVNNALNGTTDYIKTTNITSLGSAGWTIRGWVNPSALPAVGIQAALVQFSNAAAFGAYLNIFNTAGTIKFSYFLSSNGTSHDIANGVQGTTTPVIGTYYYVELTYDALAGVYRLYVNGTQENTTASAAKICVGTQLSLGSNNGSSFYNGYIDKFEFQPYCDHPNGTAYAVPVAAPSVSTAGKLTTFLSLPQMKMFEVTAASVAAGTDPTLTQRNRLFVAETDTSGVAVTAVRNYALRGKYDSGAVNVPALSVSFNASHNIGTSRVKARVYAECLTASASYSPGARVYDVMTGNAGWSGPYQAGITDRNNVAYSTQDASSVMLVPKTGGAAVSAATTQWKLGVTVERDF